MRALVIYSLLGDMQSLAEAVAQGLRKGGAAQVDVIPADGGGRGVIAAAGYDLICLGSPVSGRFGGAVPEDLEPTLKRCSRLNGKQGAVFVKSRIFGTAKSMRVLMGLLEHQGVQVRDFDAFSTPSQAETFGQRLVFSPRD